MRVRGIVKIVLTLVISFALMSWSVGVEVATVAISLISLYAWLGEYIAILKAGVISEKELDIYEKNKLYRIKEHVIKCVKINTGEDVSYFKLHIIPSDDVNGMAFGISHISLTQGAVDSCDEMTLCAILCHEVSHILCLDSVFNRIIFGDITFVIFELMVVSYVSIVFIWIVFIILILCGICRGFISVFITSSLSKGVKSLFELIQYGALFTYQVTIAAVSRQFEYRADGYAVDLGFGTQLTYFLNRFASSQDGRRKSLSEILYASHPATHLRIQKINQRQIVKKNK